MLTIIVQRKLCVFNNWNTDGTKNNNMSVAEKACAGTYKWTAENSSEGVILCAAPKGGLCVGVYPQYRSTYHNHLYQHV